MNECMPVMNTGLRGASVASTKISNVDGALGKLIYRGYLVADLAQKASFEEIVYLLLYEDLPNREELAQFKQQLTEKRKVPESVFGFMKALLHKGPHLCLPFCGHGFSIRRTPWWGQCTGNGNAKSH